MDFINQGEYMLVLEHNVWIDYIFWVLGGIFLILFLLELFPNKEIPSNDKQKDKRNWSPYIPENYNGK